MNPKNIFILDDSPSISELIRARLKEEYAEAVPSIECYNDEFSFRKRLAPCDPKQTLLIVNATFKPGLGSYRFQLEGIRQIIKLSLRIMWLRLDPVIAYSVIPEDEIFNSPAGRVFSLDRSHKYFNLTKIKETDMKSLIEAILPIDDKNALKRIISDFCDEELKLFVSKFCHMVGNLGQLNFDGKSIREEYLKPIRLIFPEIFNKEMKGLMGKLEREERPNRKIIDDLTKIKVRLEGKYAR